MRSVDARVLAVALLLVALGGCGPSTGASVAQRPTLAPYMLTVDDRSSWGTLRIMIGDTLVGSVGCDETVTVTPGAPGVPSLPWTIRLVTMSGQTVDQRLEDGLAGPRWLFVFDVQIEEGGSPALGPMPPCAFPSPSLEPLPTQGLTSAEAIDLGSRLATARSEGPVAIQSATIGRLATYATVAGVDPQTPVWAMSFSGSFGDPSMCVPSPSATPCPSQANVLVGLNFATGTELALLVPAPPGS